MKTISRRELLKSSLLAPAAVASVQGATAAQGGGPVHAAINAVSGEVSGPLSAGGSLASPKLDAVRERLLLDFGWRFHFGHACDPACFCE